MEKDQLDLNDDEISTLLQQAETRMQAAHEASLGPVSVPKLKSNVPSPYVAAAHEVAKAYVPENTDSMIDVQNDQVKAKGRNGTKTKALDAGSDWYNLPRTVLTPSLKRDLQLIKMRNVLDGHRHYKKDNSTAKFPEFSQVGTVIEGPTEFFSGRLQRKDRNDTFAGELLENETHSGRMKSKFSEVQVRKTSGKKAHYRAKQARRAAKR